MTALVDGKRQRTLVDAHSCGALTDAHAHDSTELDSVLEHWSGVLHATADLTSSLVEFMKHDVRATPNPRNPRTFLKRKQCTFVLPGVRHYKFGQYNQHFVSDTSEWPTLVERAFSIARARAPDPSLYTGVHVNLYVDGGVGVAPHSDKEESMVHGQPIYSFTVLEDSDTPRPFSVYSRDGVKLRDVMLHDGDLLIMKGSMQDRFLHGIEKHKPARAFRARVNLTVRAFAPLRGSPAPSPSLS